MTGPTNPHSQDQDAATKPTRGGGAQSGTAVRDQLGLTLDQWQRARAAGLIPPPDQSTSRWSPARVQDLVTRREELVAGIPDDADTDQVRSALGWSWAVFYRARTAGLIPPPDRGRYWTRPVVDDLVARAAELTAAVPAQTLGANRCADILTQATGRPVTWADVGDLTRSGHLQAVGRFKRWNLYDPAQVQALAATVEGRAIIAAHHLLTADQAAQHLRCRRVDVERLTSGGWLIAAVEVRSQEHPRARVPLYRTGDLDTLLTHPDQDWPTIRATAPSRPSTVPPQLGTDHSPEATR